MIAARRDSGLAAPQLEEIATRVRFPAMVNHPTLDDKDQAIADGLSDGAGKFTSEIDAGIGLTSRATRTRLA
jgi:hypothetical protein